MQCSDCCVCVCLDDGTVVAVYDSMYEFECSEFFEPYDTDDVVSPYTIRCVSG